MTAKTLMFMGTGSDVGKSLLVAGLCRALVNRGIKVAPFKPQNMSNNAAVTIDGGEIGRAQALQARAAKIDPITNMNPILLKPEQDRGAQIIVRGQRVGSMPAKQYFAERGKYMPQLTDAFSDLAGEHDIVLVEGAGSASEVNLRHNDLANFGFAQAVGAPVIVIGDIERGGVIASLVGTLQVIAKDDAALIAGTLVNKFHGDPELFEDGKTLIQSQTNLPCFGPVPYFNRAHLLPAEDVLGLASSAGKDSQTIKIVVPRLPRISNFDDLDPLRAEPNVSIQILERGHALPVDANLVLLVGSKTTIADLQALKDEGWDIDIRAHLRRGGRVMGLCGGYQMLGQSIADPQGLEGSIAQIEGLGLLNVTTHMTPQKQLRIEAGTDSQFEQTLSGYHMHLGQTQGEDCARPFARVNGENEGAISADGLVVGTYLHGIFSSDGFRRSFLENLKAGSSTALNFEHQIDQILDEFAHHLETHLDIDKLLDLAVRPKV